MKKIHKKLALTSGGGTITIKIADLNSYYHVVGSDITLTSNLTIQTDSNLSGHVIEMYWSQKVTLDGNTVTLFGNTISRTEMDNVLVRAIYNGSTWDVWVIDNVNLSELQSSPVDTDGLIQVSDGSGGFTYVPNYTASETIGFVLGNNPDIEAESFVVGSSNTADSYVIIIGGSYNTFATGIRGIVLGNNNEINGDKSLLTGEYLISNAAREIVVGIYNEDISATSATTWNTADVLFQIGNGTSDGARNTTLKMLKDGSTTVDSVWTFEAGISVVNNIIDVTASTYAYNPTDDLHEAILAVAYTATGAVAISLDAGVLAKNTKIIIKDTGGNASVNNITITPDSGLIDGAANLVLSTDYESVTLFTDGTNFFVV